MYQHFLLTRFNLRKADWEKDKNSQTVLNKEWLKNRINLFIAYCLPSILGQTSKNFKWLIFFQDDPEEEVKELIEKLKPYSFIEPIFVKGFEKFHNSLSDYLVTRTKKETKWVLTTRFDNDDALNKNFIEVLQQLIGRPERDSLIHFPNGLFLDLSEQNKLAASYYPFNQFLSLLENVTISSPRTVLSQPHDQWDSSYGIREVPFDDAWLQITHSRNMANTFKGVPVFSSRLKNFRIENVHFSWKYDLKLMILGIKKRLKNIWAI
jgi:hypothetical protein